MGWVAEAKPLTPKQRGALTCLAVGMVEMCRVKMGRAEHIKYFVGDKEVTHLLNNLRMRGLVIGHPRELNSKGWAELSNQTIDSNQGKDNGVS